MKRLLAIIIAVTALLTACGNPIVEEQVEEEKDDKIEIGMSFDSFVIERWQKDRDIFVSTAQSLGATVDVQNANGDVDKQIEQVDHLIEKGVDCLVIIAVDATALTDSVEKAHEAGIPVVAYDRILTNCGADLYISFDNVEVGRLMGQAIADSGATNVIMICGPLTDGNVPMICQGFNSVMEARNIEVLDTMYAEGWKAELGSSYVYDNMSLVRQADAIMCGNDDLATAVIRALAVGQLAGNITVVGQDADLPACQHIVEGTQDMTVYKPVEKLATEAARYAVDLARTGSITVEETINDGVTEVPYVALSPVAITIDNIDKEIIDSGFHNREDVYMNVTE